MFAMISMMFRKVLIWCKDCGFPKGDSRYLLWIEAFFLQIGHAEGPVLSFLTEGSRWRGSNASGLDRKSAILSQKELYPRSTRNYCEGHSRPPIRVSFFLKHGLPARLLQPSARQQPSHMGDQRGPVLEGSSK